MTVPIAGIQCGDCKHVYKDGPPPTCAAFPDGIPDAILKGEHDHTRPYEGDRGIRFEAAKGQEPTPATR